MSRKCVNAADNFCYICGEVTFKKHQRTLTPLVKKCYELYFGCKVGDQDKKWAPHICCLSCVKKLTGWVKGNGKMKFGVPMVWREPHDHSSDCYFCLTNIKGINDKSKYNVTYPNLPSAIRPIPHCDDLPVPIAPQHFTYDSDEELTTEFDHDGEDPTYVASDTFNRPHFITQGDLNDLVRDLNLSKKQSELLASRLKGWNLLHEKTKVCYYRSRQEEFEEFYATENSLVYCKDVPSVMNALGHKHITEEWRLFIDSSKLSLKAVLLHNGNEYPSVPLAYSTSMKETYENMKIMLEKIQYDKHEWKICCDLKVVAILTGLQLGFTKFCCFLCEWDSRDKSNHYVKKEWPKREKFTSGQRNIAHPALVHSKDILLPALHIKLGLFKNFVKAINKGGAGFQYLKEKFPGVSDAKIKEGVFVGPQIRQLIADDEFGKLLNQVERSA